ncbi:MAG: oligosaccharide flippase family protein [Chitinophagales bacterium]|nr:oligosaccharide flippase family protein [Chitinophagales bacterium]HAE13188.1 hypothetical protein [Bacteroidota bacterium]MCB9018729.1 oligosaccharide flippase family protein [Chitinophagales bacterium]MCB9020980.1 oligosaccharide flippase family protein [Chitinophagales bacterium]HAE36143.1 hypothetical protein [Bacteroidota bacterium]
MKRSFLSNLAFLLFLNFLVKPFWILGIDRTVQNVTGPDQYGLYFSLFNFSLLFQVLLDFGINNFNNREIAKYPEKLGQTWSTMLQSKAIFALLYAALVLIVAVLIGFDQTHWRILGWMILMQVMLSFFTYLRSNVSALHLFRHDAVLSVSDKLFAGTLCALLFWTKVLPWEITVKNFIICQILGYSLASVLAILMLLGRRIHWKWTTDLQLIRQVIRKSAPFALLTFLMAAYYRIDGVMIERMLGAEGAHQAGVYASAFRLLDALSIIGYMFAAILLPMFSRMQEEGSNVQPLLETGLRLMACISVPAGTTFIFFRQEIMQALYADATNQYGQIFGWLMAGFVLISLVYILGTMLTALGSLRILNRIAAAGLVVNVALNLLLIPTQQAVGAAIATVCTQTIVLILHLAAVYSRTDITFHQGMWLRLAGLTAACVVICPGVLWLNLPWAIAMGLCLLLGACLALLLGLVKRHDWKPLLHEAAEPAT